MRGLNNKVVIVTGGSNGIGKATCYAYIKKGAVVVIADIDSNNGELLETELKKIGGHALFVKTDVSCEPSVESMVKTTVQNFGTINVLINNAVVHVIKGIDATVEDWYKVISVNVISYALCAKHCLPIMEKAGGGSIVNMSSISGFIAQPNHLTYNTTKGAVINMTRCMALDFAKYNIRVNAICPGSVWTESKAVYFKEKKGMNKEQAEAKLQLSDKYMIKRNAEPDEIADAILFLSSDSASFITGENLVIDGGYTAK